MCNFEWRNDGTSKNNRNVLYSLSTSLVYLIPWRLLWKWVIGDRHWAFGHLGISQEFIAMICLSCNWPIPKSTSFESSICVVVQFYPWFKFYFPLFSGLVMYDFEFKTKENKIWTKDKTEPRHIHQILLIRLFKIFYGLCQAEILFVISR